MTREELYEEIKRKGSFLCVGLDTDKMKLPVGVTMVEFNRAIVDATVEYAVAYKPNLAFYEGRWEVFEDTCIYIKEHYPEVMIIADAKRGDIGNTSRMYARAFYADNLTDAVTLTPYMGRDSIEPFLKYKDKWAVVLALTSNESADDFETQAMADGRPLWKHVLEKTATWGTPDDTMFVVGATRAEMLKEVREIVPEHFLLVPGVGAQGGSLQEVARWGMNEKCGLLVNSSRGIIYASQEADFAEAAEREARKIAEEMRTLL